MKPETQYAQVARLFLEGHNEVEVAQRLGITTFSVRAARTRAQHAGLLKSPRAARRENAALLDRVKTAQRNHGLPPSGSVSDILRRLPADRTDAFIARVGRKDVALSETIARIVEESLRAG
jgi:hypothetical protein